MEGDFLTPTLIEAAMEEEFLTLTMIEAAMEEEVLGLNFQPNECGGRIDDGVDRISQLPDEILVDILSFLSLRESSATSVLSSRWLNLWKHTPNLDFDKLNFMNLHVYDFKPSVVDILSDAHVLRWTCKCKEIVNSVIKSHKALSLKTFRICLSLRKSDKWAVTKWLEFVFSRQVESLELDFLFYEEEYQLVLGELLRESRICLQPQTDLIFFHSLKTLSLKCLIVSGEDIELFVRNCPLLEKLRIVFTTLTSDVELCGVNLMLKHVEIRQCKGQISIKVSAPNLCTMYVDEGAKLFLENLPKLVEATFSFIMRQDIVAQHFASLKSCYFPLLQILRLYLFDSEILFPLQEILANGFRQMPNLKKLDIFCNYFVVPAIALIWTFPRLEEFEITFGSYREEQPAYMQDVMTDTGISPHQHLKVFKLHMSLKQDVCNDIVKLVAYLSNNCVALRKIVIADESKANDTANMDCLTQQLEGKVASHIQLELS